MSPVLRWWDRLPSLVRWVVGVVYSVGGALLILATVAAVGPDDWSLSTIMLVGGAVSLVIFFPLGIAVQARRLGGWHQFALWRRAYSTGVVDGDAAVDRWLPIARRNLRYLRQSRALYRVWTIGVLGLLALVSIALVVVAQDWRILLVQAVLILFLGAVSWVGVRVLRWRVEQLERLVPTLEARSSERRSGGSSTE